METSKKILQELVAIRKELQAIRNRLELNSDISIHSSIIGRRENHEVIGGKRNGK